MVVNEARIQVLREDTADCLLADARPPVQVDDHGSPRPPPLHQARTTGTARLFASACSRIRDCVIPATWPRTATMAPRPGQAKGGRAEQLSRAPPPLPG